MTSEVEIRKDAHCLHYTDLHSLNLYFFNEYVYFNRKRRNSKVTVFFRKYSVITTFIQQSYFKTSAL